MLIQTTELILNYDGMPVPFEPSGTDRPTMLRDVVHMALNNPQPDERPSMEQKAEWFRLTQLFYADATAEITVGDAAVIEERAALLLSPLVYGRIHEVFARQSSLAVVPDAQDG